MNFYQRNKPSVRKQHQRTSSTLPLLLTIALLFSLIPHNATYAQEGGEVYLPFINNGGNAAPALPSSSTTISTEQIEGQNFLVASNASGQAGAPLYYYLEDNEETSESACDKTCAEAWPPLTVASANQLSADSDIAEQFGTIQREDGALQVTYNGWPLYRYVGDDISTTIDSDSVTAAETPSITANGQGIDGLWWRAEMTEQIVEELDESVNANAVFRASSSVVTSFAESGTVSTHQPNRTEWHTINLNRRYTQPVVIMQPLSHRGTNPSTVRVRNVTNGSFQFKIDEWAYLDGPHMTETIHYMVIEAGVHTLPNSGGMKLHAGLADVNHNWANVSFQEAFTRTPIVLSQVQSVNGGEPLVTRQRGINRTRVQLRLQESEASDGPHSMETVGYLAMEPGEAYLGDQSIKAGRTGNVVTHIPRKINFGATYEDPILLAAMQTFDGSDTAGLRYKELTTSSVTLFVEEEQSANSEMAHTTEVIGYIVLGSNDDPPTATPTPTPTITITPTPVTPTVTPAPGQVFFIVEPERVRAVYEKTGRKTNMVTIQRQGGSGAINVAFNQLGHTNATRSSAAPADYIIRGSDGQLLTNKIPFKVGQMAHTITVEAVADEQIEVLEMLRIQLQSGSGYTVRDTESTVRFILRDDRPGVTAESRFFFGQMVPENGAATTATGWAVVRLSNDNNYGLISVSFSGLTSVETASHVHYANPISGPIIHSIPLGQVVDDRWNIRAAHQATTDQAMLDAILSGNTYINVHTMDNTGGEIRGTMRLTAGSPAFTPPGPAAPIEVLTGEALQRDIMRFLTQASFGPTVESVADMQARVARHGGNRIKAYNEWITEQVALESPSSLEFLHANMQSYSSTAPDGGITRAARIANTHAFPSWYTSAVYSKAQLRERLAFALSEILVVSNADNTIRAFSWFTASYDDLLADNAFGSYRGLLTKVSRHPAMAHYLSHFRNQKEKTDADGTVISSPDENYAREVMQLFSIGLVNRHLDGSLKLGADGLPSRTYDQTDISELSRVFTGWANSVQMTDGGLTNTTTPNGNFNYTGRATTFGTKQFYKPHMTLPLKMFNEFHDSGEKQWRGRTILANRTGGQELSQVMNVLGNDPNTAVLVSRQLIQRMVTSNPSAGYLYRVATRFDETNGNLTAVVRAILLDPEARNLNQTTNVGRGKVKEPMLQIIAMMRLLKPKPDTADTYNFARLQEYGYPASEVNLFEPNADILYLNRCLGPCFRVFAQAPMYAPTVFNYFMPDFAPPGPIIDSGLVAPELQLLDENNVTGLYNSAYYLLFTATGLSGIRPVDGGTNARTTYVQPQWMADAYIDVMDSNGDGTISSTDASFNNDSKIREASAALVDLADDYLCTGRLQANATGNPQTDAREIIITGVKDAIAFRDANQAQTARALDERLREALYLVATAPQCTYME